MSVQYTLMATEDDVRALALSLGFDAVRFTTPAAPDHGEFVLAWLAAGMHGKMGYLWERRKQRNGPLHSQKLLAGAKSVVVVALSYDFPEGERPSGATGTVARYARGEDYHVVVRKRLRRLAAALRRDFPGEEFRICCDLLPLLERDVAERAGLGRIGKHTLLIEHGGGSYLLLGEIVTTMDAAPSVPRSGVGDPCGTCVRCIEACPTGAIEPYRVDASKCLSYTTIEHREAIDERFWTPTGDWLFGCDICQEVCPHNQPTRRRRRLPTNPAYEPRLATLDLLAILGWSEADRLAATMRSAVRRAQLAMLKRNAIVCLANAVTRRPDTAIVERLGEIAASEDEDPLVRETARRAVERLAQSDCGE